MMARLECMKQNLQREKSSCDPSGKWQKSVERPREKEKSREDNEEEKEEDKEGIA